MLKRYIGPYDEVSLFVAGNEIGIVKNGESIAVPDDLAESVAWSPDLWDDGGKPSAKSSANGEGDN